MQISTATQQFLQYLVDKNRSPSTVIAYRKDLQQLEEYLTDLEISKIDTQLLRSFLSDITKYNYSVKTISRKLNSIKSLFKYLVEYKYLASDPTKTIAHPIFESKLPRCLSEQEYRSIRDLARNNIRLYTLIELMLQTGLRIGEISRLRLENIKLKSNPPLILITENASSPMRTVELNKAAISVLTTFIPNRLMLKEEQGYLFNTKNGKNMLIRNIRSSVNKILKKSGIKNATVNDLRNTFIVHQLNAGVSLEKVAQTVGHRRYSSTEKYLLLVTRAKLGRANKVVIL